jgi:hypothetical protein
MAGRPSALLVIASGTYVIAVRMKDGEHSTQAFVSSCMTSGPFELDVSVMKRAQNRVKKGKGFPLQA